MHRAVPKTPDRPKLVVLLVVDQMRGDYVDKFRGQWTGGLKRLIDEGAWFRDAAYPYAATETCVGHATISTGAFPATHGMVANAWWDRETQKMVTCTADPKAKNSGYAGVSAKGGDSAWRMQVPAFAEELKFQTGSATRVVTFSLKARASITMAGHKGDAATWFDAGGWVTSSVYGTMPFIDDYVKAHPVKDGLRKDLDVVSPGKRLLVRRKSTGAVPPDGWEPAFPHPLRGKAAANEPDEAFYEQWATSPFADTYLTRLAETAVDSLGLGKSGGTDFLGDQLLLGGLRRPRIRPAQPRDSGHSGAARTRTSRELFAHLDKKVGRGNYVVALSADHGVVPIPEDMQKTGADAGVLRLPELQERIEKALEPFNYAKPAIARITGSDIYFAPAIYASLKQNRAAMQAVLGCRAGAARRRGSLSRRGAARSASDAKPHAQAPWPKAISRAAAAIYSSCQNHTG